MMQLNRNSETRESPQGCLRRTAGHSRGTDERHKHRGEEEVAERTLQQSRQVEESYIVTLAVGEERGEWT